MKKLRTLLILLVIIGINVAVLSLKDTVFIVATFFMIGSISMIITSPSQTVNHIQFFVWIALSIFIFQTIFVRNVNLETTVLLTVRIALQLFIVSEVVRTGIRYISPVSLMSFFAFLPKNIRLLIAMTFYFIPLTMKEYEIIKQIQVSRGLGKSIRSKYIAPIAFIIPLLHRVFQRSEGVTNSIIARGWREV